MLDNIYQFLIGQTRYILYKINPKFIRLHIREQVGERQSACSPICLYEARCCGCKAPNVFFAPKGCRFNSYPALMNKEEWYQYNLRYKERMNLLYPVYQELNEWPFSINTFSIMKMSLYDIFTWRSKHVFTIATATSDNSDIDEDDDLTIDFSHLNNVEHS